MVGPGIVSVSLCQPRLPSTVPVCALTLQRTSPQAPGAGTSSQSWGSVRAPHWFLPRLMRVRTQAIQGQRLKFAVSFPSSPCSPQPRGQGLMRTGAAPCWQGRAMAGGASFPTSFWGESGPIGKGRQAAVFWSVATVGLPEVNKTRLPAKSLQSSLRNGTDICTGRGEPEAERQQMRRGVLAPSATAE